MVKLISASYYFSAATPLAPTFAPTTATAAPVSDPTSSSNSIDTSVIIIAGTIVICSFAFLVMFCCAVWYFVIREKGGTAEVEGVVFFDNPISARRSSVEIFVKEGFDDFDNATS